MAFVDCCFSHHGILAQIFLLTANYPTETARRLRTRFDTSFYTGLGVMVLDDIPHDPDGISSPPLAARRSPALPGP